MKLLLIIALGIGLGSFSSKSIAEGDPVALTKARIDNLSRAADLFFTDCGFYPDALDALVKKVNDCKHWGREAYLKDRASLKDAWGRPIIYTKFSYTEHEFKSLGPTESDVTSPKGEIIFSTKKINN